MKDFMEIVKSAKLKVLVDELEVMGVHKMVNDVYFKKDCAVLFFKPSVNPVILKDLQLMFKSTVSTCENGVKQFIYNF